ncbi:trans-sialidase, putative [Trypanosoma cruzi marinkellei]|uniref:Trans-sialidase, putative n=1 Tax=Trypanosoma cruzi marinkellei TaxID=85056 RepID=K2N4Z7_TRYCR|nr:trans-sialidase, putative [Trypanosoma cruzi marinkellei]
MLSRVAAVKAPRTHNRRRVTGSSGRRREGRESEPQRPNMSRRVFTSAVLLLLFVMMFCGTGGAAQAGVEQLPGSRFVWRDVTADDITVDSLAVPGLLNVGSDVFAVAEAQYKKKGENTVLTGIASQLLTKTTDNERIEVLKDARVTQVLEKVTSADAEKNVDLSRPSAVLNGSNIYMLVGKNSRTAATGTVKSGADESGLLLVKGQVGTVTGNNHILWKEIDGLQCTIGDQDNSLKRLIGGGGSGIKMQDGTVLFPVEGTKKEAGTAKDGKTVSLIIYSSATDGWTLSKGMSADGCSDPSVVEREDGKLMMMTACDDGRRRVYESGDKGESWTEALGTLSRVWGKKQDKGMKLVRSGFITATLGDGNKKVMLVTLPVYSTENGKEKGVLHLWLTDNTHIVDIGPVSEKDDDAAASSLLYKSGDNGDNAKKDELIALYEKKNADGKSPSLGMVSVVLTEELKRVKEVLTTWKKVDERVSKLCPSLSAAQEISAANAYSAVNITAGLVGFLSGNFSNDIWRDEYLGVNATVTGTATVATEPVDGVKFTGRGAGAEWPVGKQGENQPYHFANYNFTLVATVSIDGEPEEGTIPLMGVKMKDGGENTVLLGLSYNKEGKWAVLCNGTTTETHSSNWELDTTHQVAIVLQNSSQGSVYVDGHLLGSESCALEIKKDSEKISHFYIGGDGGSAGSQEGVHVTVGNVLLYNRPWTSEEIAGLVEKKNTVPISEDPEIMEERPSPPAASESGVKGAVLQSTPGGPQRMEQKQLKGVGDAEGGGVSGAASTATTSSSNYGQTVVTGSRDTMQGDGSPQTPDVRGSSGGYGGSAGGTDAQGEGIQPQDGEVNATALNSSLGNMSWGNNTGDASTVGGSGLLPLLLLLLGLWVFAAL